MPPQSPDSAHIRCLCATTRRAARLLNRRYEEALRPAGVSTSQYELMQTLRGGGLRDQIALAQSLEIDQTTLSRNLKLLLAARWIDASPHDVDARRRIYRLTALGLVVLTEAHRCWRLAHEEMERQLGEPMAALWPLLDRILAAARSPSQPA